MISHMIDLRILEGFDLAWEWYSYTFEKDDGTEIEHDRFLPVISLGNISVGWVNLGEGAEGDYDPDDSFDLNLLRLDVMVRDEFGELMDLSDASFCTQVPHHTTTDLLIHGLIEAMNCVHDPIQHDQSIKRICESFSWWSKDDLKEFKLRHTPKS